MTREEQCPVTTQPKPCRMTHRELWTEFLVHDPPWAIVPFAGMYCVTVDCVNLLGVSNTSPEAAIAAALEVEVEEDLQAVAQCEADDLLDALEAACLTQGPLYTLFVGGRGSTDRRPAKVQIGPRGMELMGNTLRDALRKLATDPGDRQAQALTRAEMPK